MRSDGAFDEGFVAVAKRNDSLRDYLPLMAYSRNCKSKTRRSEYERDWKEY